MRFLILSQYFPPEVGAAQVRLAACTRELVRLGHAVEVVTALPSYPHGRTEPAYRGRVIVHESLDGARVHRVWAYPAQGGGWRRVVGYLSFAVLGLGFLFSVKRPDVVFVESPPLTLAITGFLYRLRFPTAKLVFNVADLWPDLARDFGLLRDGVVLRLLYRLEAFAYRTADFVTYVPQAYRDILVTGKGVPVEKLLYLPNGVSSRPVAAALPATLGRFRDETRRIFAVVGTHGLAHGLDVVLRAAKRLEDKEVVFLLVGEGSDKARLIALAAELDCRNVVFHDAVAPDVVPSILAMTYACISTLKDMACMDNARPVRILAAMAAGKPVLYAGRGEGAELITKAGAGIVVPPENEAALAEAVASLLARPDEAAAMGAHGRAFVANHLSWDRIVGEWLDALEARMADAAGPPARSTRALASGS